MMIEICVFGYETLASEHITIICGLGLFRFQAIQMLTQRERESIQIAVMFVLVNSRVRVFGWLWFLFDHFCIFNETLDGIITVETKHSNNIDAHCPH